MIDPRKSIRGKVALVTGGAGFIGSHLCDRLLEYGAKTVVCFDDLSTGNPGYPAGQKNNPRFVFVRGDANKLAPLEKAFRKYRPAYVLHYAAVVGVKRTVEQPMAVLRDIEGIKHICDLSHKYGAQKIVFASSSEVYGNQKEVPYHEDMSYHDTRHPYALVKATGEAYLRSFSQITGIPVVSLRFFNVYGPRQASSAYGFVTGIFISQVLQGQAPTIFRDGTQTRDFTYIDDNVEAGIQALVSPKANGEVLNIGTGVETSIFDLAKRIIAFSGKGLAPSLMHHRSAVEAQRRVANTDKLRTALGFSCKTSLDEGLKKTYLWYKENPRFMLAPAEWSYERYDRDVKTLHKSLRRKTPPGTSV